VSSTVLGNSCLIFPFSRVNANAIGALVGSLDIHPILKDLKIYFPKISEIPEQDKYQNFQRIILAVSVYSTQVAKISKLIELYRKALKNKKLIVIAGGPHPTGDPFSMLINGPDIVCVGEGEAVFTEFIMKYLENDDYFNIKGLAYIENGILIKNPKPNPINLDEYPPFSVKHKIYRPIEITRGCAWKCRFCQIRSKGMPVRHRSVDQVLVYVDEIKKYFTRRRPDIRFISPNALSYGSPDGKNLDLNKVEELLSSIRNIVGEKGHIYFGSFPSEVRPETITVESVEILKKYTNSKKIIVGGQSGSDKVLKLADRGHSADETERAVKLLIKYDFEVDVDIIFGLPGEELTDVTDTMTHMQKLTEAGATIHSHTFMPLVGTPFANKEPGRIHNQYVELIVDLQNNRKLKGMHEKQEEIAKDLAIRKESDKEKKVIQSNHAGNLD